MFKRLFTAWRTGDLLRNALEETSVMLSKAEGMYASVTDQLLYNKEIPFDIYKADRELNLAEIEIRRKIMEDIDRFLAGEPPRFCANPQVFAK